MLSYKKLSLVVGIVIIIVIVLNLSTSDIDDKPPSKPQEIANSPSIKTQIGVNKRIEARVSKALDTNSYGVCTRIKEEATTLAFDWAKGNYQTWTSFIDQGYSLDEVTLAVEHFLSRTFAKEFRLNQLRSNTTYAKKTLALRKQMELKYPASALKYISFENYEVNDKLKSFLNLSEQEKRRTIAETEVQVDDLAYFMHDLDASESDLLLLLDAIEDPTAIVTSAMLDAISLLDFAAAAGRPKVFNALINKGLMPTHDEYLRSTMEHALWGIPPVQLASNRDFTRKSVNIIKQLIAMGASAQFTEKTPEFIDGNGFVFFAEDISSLYIDFNVDLSQIRERKVLQIDSNHPLIIQLENQKQTMLANALDIPEVKAFLGACDGTITSREEAWQPASQFNVVREMVERIGKNSNTLYLELSAIDPSLVDYFRENYVPRPYMNPIAPELKKQINGIYKYLKEGSLAQAIESVAAVHIYENQKTWVLYRFLDHGAEYYDELMKSPLQAELGEYRDFVGSRLLNVDAIKKLSAAGAPIFDADSMGKTLVYYAGMLRDVSLLRYLRDESFPFNEDTFGQDPLHLALNIDKEGANLDATAESVNILMDYQPKIDKAHLSRMALIKHFYPDLYDNIIVSHPSLIVDDTTPLPVVRLTNEY